MPFLGAKPVHCVAKHGAHTGQSASVERVALGAGSLRGLATALWANVLTFATVSIATGCDGGLPESPQETAAKWAFEFRGFRVLVPSADDADVRRVATREQDVLGSSGAPGYAYDGIVWGRSDAEYSGFTFDITRRHVEFSYFGETDKPDLPRETELFGRTTRFAWRGDMVRDIRIRETFDKREPRFWVGLRQFDQLVRTTLRPADAFAVEVDRYGLAQGTVHRDVEPDGTIDLSASSALVSLRLRYKPPAGAEEGSPEWEWRFIDPTQDTTLLYHVEARSVAHEPLTMPKRPSQFLTSYRDLIPDIDTVSILDYTDETGWGDVNVKKEVSETALMTRAASLVVAVLTLALWRLTQRKPAPIHHVHLRGKT